MGQIIEKVSEGIENPCKPRRLCLGHLDFLEFSLFSFFQEKESKGQSINVLLKVFIFILVYSPYKSYSQEKDSLSLFPDSVHSFEEVVVKASRHEVLVKNIAASVQVLNKQFIQSPGNAGIPAILNQVPGLNMQSGGNQTSRLTLRGVGSRNPYGSGRIRAFYEDIPLSAGDGTTIIEDLEPFFIEKVEVTKGPNSAWYGSGLGGSVRFFGPENDKKNHFHVFSGLASFGEWKAGALASVNIVKGQFNVGFSRNEGNGFRENSEFSRNTIFLSGKSGITQQLSFLFQASDVRSEIASSLDESTFLLHPEKAAANWNRIQGYKKYQRLIGGIRLKSELSSNLINAISFSGNINDPYELRPFNILDDLSRSFQVGEQLQFVRGNHSFLTGIERLHENYQWRILKNNSLVEQQKSKELRDQWNVFASWDWEISSSFHASVGLNLNQTQYEIMDLFESDSVDFSGKTDKKYMFSPRFGINYAVNYNVNLYSSFGHGFSNPTVEESLNSQGFINPNLKPEQGLGFDAGLRAYLLKRMIWLDVAFYRIQLRQLLVTKRISEEIFSGENAGNAYLQGLELFSHIQAFRWMDVVLSYQQSQNKFKTYISDGVDYSHKNLPGIPNYNLNVELNFCFLKNFKSGIRFTNSGKQYLNDGNSLQSSSWKTFDVKLNYSKNIKTSKLELQAGIRNLFNEHYASMILINAPSLGGNLPRYYYPGMPGNIYLSLVIGF